MFDSQPAERISKLSLRWPIAAATCCCCCWFCSPKANISSAVEFCRQPQQHLSCLPLMRITSHLPPCIAQNVLISQPRASQPCKPQNSEQPTLLTGIAPGLLVCASGVTACLPSRGLTADGLRPRFEEPDAFEAFEVCRYPLLSSIQGEQQLGSCSLSVLCFQSVLNMPQRLEAGPDT